MKYTSHRKIKMDFSTLALGALLLIFLLLSVASFIYVNIQTNYDKEYIRLAGELRYLSQSMATSAAESGNSNVSTFTALRENRGRFQGNLTLLQEGNLDMSLPPSPDSLRNYLNDVDLLWRTFSQHAQTILDEENTIRSLNQIIDRMDDSMPELFSLSDQVVSIMIKAGMSAKQIYVASRQLILIPRISANANKIAHQNKQHSANSNDASLNLQKDTAHFGRILNAMLSGNRVMGIEKIMDSDARAKLAKVTKLYQQINDMTAQLLLQTPRLLKAQLAASEIIASSPAVLQSSTALTQAYSNPGKTRLINDVTRNSLGAITLGLLVLLSFRIQRNTRKNLIKAEQQNRRNQNAIGRLLDEINTLADGDLSAHATVTEDISGPIADAINYTTEQLRRLVSTINTTTVQISSATQATQATAMHLEDASDQQAKQITAASVAIKDMAIYIDTASSTAERSSEAATQSVEIAKKGAVAVQDSIRSMDTIREKIQAASKRIKRLGESSQEISDVVDLINEIAEQTNILALNTAIQASMAGESGHSFAIVADEVQHLATKTCDATSKIESLVSTILAATHEAVVSMEQSAAQVVRGTNITQNAAQSLIEIENASTLLAELTQSISASVQQQSGTALNISEIINVIEKMASQNLSGTNKPSLSAVHLAELSDELRESVAGFKLPDQQQ